MIIILGIICGLVWGFIHGRKLSDNRADRLMYIGSYGLAGFTLGLIFTLILQFFLS